MLIYLDWNVFDRIEKLEKLNDDEQLLYSTLQKIISSDNIYVPYSNAHLRDLLRGYKKNPKYINGHLQIINDLTSNLCICQYWKEKKVTWHYRSVNDFFEELKNEKKYEAENFKDLVDFGTNGLGESYNSIQKLIPVPKEFKKIYSEDPIFNIIYPRTKIEMNHYALAEDLYNFSILITKDYSLYVTLKKLIIKSIHKLRKHHKVVKSLKSMNIELPKYLDIDSIIDEFEKYQKIEKDNPHYHKIFDTYFRYDLKGYKTDNMFPNMVDDGLHTSYAAHCDFFITNDDKCHYKALKTYERLGIKTKVFTAKEFVNNFPAVQSQYQ